MWRQSQARAGASVALAGGRPEEARAIVADLLSAGMPSRSAVMFAVPAYVVGLRAEADIAARLRALGDGAGAGEAVARGGELLDRMRAVAAPEQWPLGPPPVELLLHVELGELELARARATAEADAWADHAAGWEDLGRPFVAAYARWREAEAAVAAGLPRQRATAPLQSARTTAERLGARLLLHEIDELARRGRLELRGPAPPSEAIAERLGLTARELDVLRLLADGRTNAQIGAELYMSPKTASVHVSHILAKLDVKTRIEAATAAHRLGLASPA
jgi:DNA-binding CsgD family transcriptional regulator